jgi:outer membrane protein, heavy metal efflux system
MIVLSVAARRSRALATILFIAARASAQDGAGNAPRIDLLSVLDSVAARHPSVLAAQARVRASEGARRTAGQFGNPMVSYEVQNTPVFSGPRGQAMDREAMTTLTLPLDQAYQRGARVSRANADVRAADADARATRQTVSIDAAHAFYRVARAQVRVDVGGDIAAWLDSVVAYDRARVGEGAAAEGDLIRTELERDRTLADLATQRAELLRATAELGAFIGDATPLVRVALSAEPMPLPSPYDQPVAAELATLQKSVSSRPDVRAAADRATAAGAGIRVEQASILRDLGGTIGTMRTLGTTSMIAGVSVALPVLNQNRGEIDRAKAERDAAVFELAASTRMATSQLAGALATARLLHDRAVALAGTPASGFLARADEARRIAIGSYREGAVPIIQVIDASRAWGESRIAYYDLVFAQHESVLDLLYADGRDPRTALAHPR